MTCWSRTAATVVEWPSRFITSRSEPPTTQKHERLGRLGRVTAQVLDQGLDHDGRQGEVRRPAALLGGPIEKAPLTSRSCSATVEGGIARPERNSRTTS